jgi:hypothetical protein
MSELPPPRFDVDADEHVFHAIAVWHDNPYVKQLHVEVAAADERQAEERVRESVRTMLVLPDRAPPDRVELWTLEDWVRVQLPSDD